MYPECPIESRECAERIVEKAASRKNYGLIRPLQRFEILSHAFLAHFPQDRFDEFPFAIALRFHLGGTFYLVAYERRNFRRPKDRGRSDRPHADVALRMREVRGTQGKIHCFPMRGLEPEMRMIRFAQSPDRALLLFQDFNPSRAPVKDVRMHAKLVESFLSREGK